MSFSIHSYRLFPVYCAATFHAGPFQGQGTVRDVPTANSGIAGNLSVSPGEDLSLHATLPNGQNISVNLLVRAALGRHLAALKKKAVKGVVILLVALLWPCMAWPGDIEVQPMGCGQSLDRMALLGLEVLEPQSRSMSDIPGRNSVIGLTVKNVRPDSLAAASGLQPGDFIYSVISPHYQNVKEHFFYTADTLPAYLSEFNGEPISLVFIRDPSPFLKEAKLIAPQSICDKQIHPHPNEKRIHPVDPHLNEKQIHLLDTHLEWTKDTLPALQEAKKSFENIRVKEIDQRTRQSASSIPIRDLIDQPTLQSQSEATRKEWMLISNRVIAQENEERALVTQILELAQRQAISTGSVTDRILAVQTKLRQLRQALFETSDAATVRTEWVQIESEFSSLPPAVLDDEMQRKVTGKGIDDLYEKVGRVRVMLAQSWKEAGQVQFRMSEDFARQKAEAKRKQEERDERERAIARQRESEQAAVRAAAEQREREKVAEKKAKFQSLLSKYHADAISSVTRVIQFFQNPFAYQGKMVFFEGSYLRNIGPNAAIVAIAAFVTNSLGTPLGQSTMIRQSEVLVQWNTTRNLADEPTPTVQCVVKILGTTVIHQGLSEREIPNVKEVECLK